MWRLFWRGSAEVVAGRRQPTSAAVRCDVEGIAADALVRAAVCVRRKLPEGARLNGAGLHSRCRANLMLAVYSTQACAYSRLTL